MNLKSYVIAALRRASYAWGPRNEAKKAAWMERGVYRCAVCGKGFKTGQYVMDHVFPVVDPVLGFTGWDDYINRMFPDASGFQVLCLEDHKLKTERENQGRTRGVKKRKKRAKK
jgi:5-methylcytosine-specific restriction endonuclease McrA